MAAREGVPASGKTGTRVCSDEQVLAIRLPQLRSARAKDIKVEVKEVRVKLIQAQIVSISANEREVY